MRVLIDIGHPAHVHLFKHFAWEMEGKGHEIFFTCREKEFEIYLLEHYGFKYKSFGKKYTSLSGKIWGMIEFDIKEFMAGLKFKPDILLSHGSIYAAHAAFLLRKPHISLEDTGNMEQIKLYKPFSETILVPESLTIHLGKKEIRYSGYHELAYLHKKKFSPDISILKEWDLVKKEKYALLRFVSWNASHDMGQTGMDDDSKREIIKLLINKNLKVFISGENKLPFDLKRYQLKIQPEKIHHFIAFCSLVVTEGATIANESAVLGVPSIYINSRKACIGDLEEYGLLFHYKNSRGVLEKINEILSMRSSVWKKHQQELLKNKIDVTAFLVWFVEHYPESVRVMRERPEYQWRFK